MSFRRLLACLLVLCSLKLASALADEATVTNFVKQYCMDCHSGSSAESGIALDQLLAPSKDNSELWQEVARQVVSANMPTADAKQPDNNESQRFVEELRAELEELGQPLEIDYQQHQPAYANLLNHERLFDRELAAEQGPAASPPRLWRLHPEAYEDYLTGFRQLNKGGPLSKPFLVGDGKGVISNYAGLYAADSATLGQLMLNCKQIAQLQTSGFRKLEMDRKVKKEVERVYQQAPESFKAIMESEAVPGQEQIEAAVREEFDIVLRREPTSDELAKFGALLKDSIEIGGNANGLRTMAMAIMLRPEAIYRMEVGLGEKDEQGRRMLSPYELAHAIAYALTDEGPDQLRFGPSKERDRSRRPTGATLLEIADSGELETREDVRRVVEQIWDAKHVEKPRVLRFFREFFGYHAVETVFKGDRAGKEFNTKILVKDADMLVLHLVEQDREVLKQLLTTEKYFVQWPGSLSEYERRIKYITDRIKPGNTKDRNYKYFIEWVGKGGSPIPQANPTWRKTVQFYNLDEKTWDYPTEQPFQMPENQRVGMLTHPAWLGAWSGNFENDPIRRGKWIREHLLAGSIPDIPITVNAAVPEDHHKTLRERLAVTREEYCWQCHRKMEPLGLPFESYDDFGQFRELEGLGATKALQKPKSTKPTQTDGGVIAAGDSELEGPVKDARELMHRLADAPRVRQSFVRHAFRFWMGRNETLQDSSILIAAYDAYEETDGSFRALVISLLTSDSFLYRR